MSQLREKSVIAEAGDESNQALTGVDDLVLLPNGARGNLLDSGWVSFADDAITILQPGEYDIIATTEWGLATPIAVGLNSLLFSVFNAVPAPIKSTLLQANGATATAGDVHNTTLVAKLNLTQAQIDAGTENVLSLSALGTAPDPEKGEVNNSTLHIKKVA